MWVLRKVPLISIFLSTLSLRRATKIKDFVYLYNFISIHALLAESDMESIAIPSIRDISIHALLAESDVNPYKLTMIFGKISIHALLAESDCCPHKHG